MVASPKSRPLTRPEFEQFADLPENRERRLEFIRGEVVEVVSYDIAGIVGMALAGPLQVYVRTNRLGFVTGSENGYRIGDDNLIPDYAFVSKDKQHRPKGETYASVVPDLVIEVKSKTDSYAALVAKVGLYLGAGVRLVWLVLPEKRRVEAFTANGVALYTADADTLDGAEVLPGFTIPVQDLFLDVD